MHTLLCTRILRQEVGYLPINIFFTAVECQVSVAVNASELLNLDLPVIVQV